MALWGETGVLRPGHDGEIVLAGDLVMKGYYKMPIKPRETIIDGWLHTGDVGLIDDRGFVFVKDRIRDVVITGGFNVYPSDVEAVLGQHPAVSECVVFDCQMTNGARAYMLRLSFRKQLIVMRRP